MNKKCDPLSTVAMVRRLVVAGCPMPYEIEQHTQPDLMIEVSRPEETIAYDMRAGAEYVFGLRITNRSYASLVLQEVRCRLPWPAKVLFPGDPRTYMPECENYRLESGRKFRCEDVLNHRVRRTEGSNRVTALKVCSWLTQCSIAFHPSTCMGTLRSPDCGASTNILANIVQNWKSSLIATQRCDPFAIDRASMA
jgi:hypothetical protein